MLIVSYTILNNEADIIESFVRYNMTYVDKMIILDNGSTDNTISILKLLQAEGYDIDIINVSRIDFEQFLIMNKYMHKIVDEYNPDWIIPLDADEFLMCEKSSVRKMIESLSKDYAYKVMWRQFVINESDDMTDSFVCRRMKHSMAHPIGKIFFPAKLVGKYNIVIETGQHSVTGNKDLVIKEIDDMNMAHFPHRSFEQVRSKALCHSVRYINYANRANGESIHRNFFSKEFIEHIDTCDEQWLYDDIRNRALRHGIDLNKADDEHPVNIELQGMSDADMKYEGLAKVNTYRNLYRLSQEMALKAYNLRMDNNFIRDAKTVLVYGTGASAATITTRFPEGLFNIRAYINSDDSSEFVMFNKRIVISPRWIKFMYFDKIIISSEKYYDEIHRILTDYDVQEEFISDYNYLVKLAMENL